MGRGVRLSEKNIDKTIQKVRENTNIDISISKIDDGIEIVCINDGDKYSVRFGDDIMFISGDFRIMRNR